MHRSLLEQDSRNTRETLIGLVTSDKRNKTRRVEVPRLVKHARYGKYIKRRTVCHVHDENNESRTGDFVEIMETRPLSKTKNWRLIRILSRTPKTSEGFASRNHQPSSPLASTVLEPNVKEMTELITLTNDLL